MAAAPTGNDPADAQQLCSNTADACSSMAAESLTFLHTDTVACVPQRLLLSPAATLLTSEALHACMLTICMLRDLAIRTRHFDCARHASFVFHRTACVLARLCTCQTACGHLCVVICHPAGPHIHQHGACDRHQQ
jgi:hypothetical protein